ncbi:MULTISPECIES: late competence development ComFB family protein [Vibrio]|uniref:Competence protein ComFB n=2 Tax=Vibrio TaxID=662 RepID=A0A1E5CLU4_9VIBR|nr:MULTISPECIES: late competence development ComFB family protein [Vibrio]RBW64387.1 competence protein ComFB [Vibrionales bacterium C3R12]MDN3699326.1 late competence development ComFB family protein [Vibrio cortegadensis]NOH83705.1 competence protein ComFB [Vibrio sp. 03-59-1]OEE70425.1 competence protein ComFB [Vibrio genomosp. F6 str. FF-238]TKF21222.1 competence protein ComFB [Vibrio genomosp. F6]
MQISVDVHNYMETLVGHVLAEDSYIEKYDNEQLADLACLALSQLRPVYIRFDIDFLSALPEKDLVKLKESALTAVIAAESMVVNDRRKNRDVDVPVIFTHSNPDDDVELEWFEKPLLNYKTE